MFVCVFAVFVFDGSWCVCWFFDFVISGVYFCIHWCACLAYCFLKSFIFIVILAGIFIYINIMYMYFMGSGLGRHIFLMTVF